MKLRRTFAAAICAFLLALGGAVFAACGDKSAKYTLTLDANGGTLSTSSLELAEGASVNDAVKDLKPTKEGVVFGAWFLGEEELPADTVMPAAPMTLVAQYKVAYTVEAYLRRDNAYTKLDQLLRGTGYVGTTITPPPIAGYSYNPDAAGNTPLVLSGNADENNFVCYYSATSISYESNPPANVTLTGSMKNSVVDESGKATVAACGFSAEGYRFAGWSTSPLGDVEYTAGQEISLTSDLTLYALWDKGYPDRYGGSDYVYLPRNESGVAILARGHAEFRGTVSNNAVLTFELNGRTLLGRIYDGAFAYARTGLAGQYLFRDSYYDPDDPNLEHAVDENNTLTVDEYGNASHTYVAEAGHTVTDVGFINYDEENDLYEFTITQGENEGEGFVYYISLVEGETDIPVFSMTKYEGGSYMEFLTPDGSIGSMGYGDVFLDGFGAITYYQIFEGGYFVKEAFDTGRGVYMYQIEAHLKDVNDQARDILGFDVDGEGNFVLEFYTIPLDSGVYGYVEPHAERGEYSGSGAGTLVLDGYGLFDKSAVYTDAEGNEHRGIYEFSASARGGVYLTMTVIENGVQLDRYFEFSLDLTDRKFSLQSAELGADDYIALEGNVFNDSVLLSIAEGADTADRTAEVYCKEGDSFVKGASGNVTAERLPGGNDIIYTFTRTQAEEGYSDRTPEKLTFLLGETYDSNYVIRKYYLVLTETYNGALSKKYTEISETDGSGKLYYMETVLNTTGTIYDTGRGTVYAGGLSIAQQTSDLTTSGPVLGNTGTFIYVAGGVANTIYFEIGYASGKPATFTVIEEAERPVFHMRETGSLDTDVNFIVRGDRGAYVGDNGVMRLGSVTVKGQSRFGQTVYTFAEDGAGATRFDFIVEAYVFVELGESTPIEIYFLYDGTKDGEFVSPSGTFASDGFHTARFTDPDGKVYNGTWHIDDFGSENVVYFTDDSGDVMIFELDGEGYELLDACYGQWDFEYDREGIMLEFDGHGSVEAWQGNYQRAAGRYTVTNSANRECNVFLDLDDDGEPEMFAFTLGYIMGNPVCFERDDARLGVFIDAEWNVLELDGYGGGSLHLADGSRGKTAYYDVIGGEDNFIRVSAEGQGIQYYNFLLDLEHHTFRAAEALGADTLYFSGSLSALYFDVSGELYVGNTMGYYYVDGNAVKAYIMPDPNYFEYNFAELTLPTEATYSYNGVTYYRWALDGTHEISMTGTVTISGGGHNETYEGATLVFSPSLENSTDPRQFTVHATFTVNGHAYQTYVINQYRDYRTGETKGLALYDAETYEYSPITAYSCEPDPAKAGSFKGTFTVAGGEVVTVMHNGFETTQASEITETYVGFGPIRLTDTTLSGTLATGGESLHFENASVLTASYSDEALGRRYMVIFEDGGKTYAFFYHKMDGDYQMYMIGTYSELETSGYTVGVVRYFYSDDGFDFFNDPSTGDVVGVVLYTGTGAEKEIVTSFNASVINGGANAWYAALGTYNPIEESGALGKAYYLTFSGSGAEGPTSVTVAEYNFKQAFAVGQQFFANFLTDDDGNIEYIVALAAYSSDAEGYLFLNITETKKISDYVWEITGKSDGVTYSYRISVSLGISGKPTEDEAGYWGITISDAGVPA